jgi:uncharacterized protein YcnI
MIRQLVISAAGTLAVVSLAHAHITLETREAPIGAGYKGVMRVPHGCDGSATTAVRIRIPDGFVAVKPMPKPGWTLDAVNAKYAKPATLNGAKINEGVTEVSWSGGKLPDAFYDEFVFTGTLADDLKAGETIYFKVVQECEKGVSRWIEIPTGHDEHGGHGASDSEPAPGLKLLPARR